MNKKIAVFSLIFFLTVILSACSQNSDVNNKSLENLNPKAEKIEVINFHATARCFSCNTLGDYSETTIYEFFQSELRDGVIEFKSINVDLPENREIARKYQAAGSSLFINAIYDNEDHIKEDVRVWRLLNNEQQFKTYLKDQINSLLNK